MLRKVVLLFFCIITISLSGCDGIDKTNSNHTDSSTIITSEADIRIEENENKDSGYTPCGNCLARYR